MLIKNLYPMEDIIPPIPREAILDELTKERFVRKTNNGNNEIFIISDYDSPNTMLEIGRLREISFRESGGGTGMSTDIDDYDRGENGFKQLLVWNPEDKEVVGGYRFIDCKNLHIDADGQVHTPTAKLFNYSQCFINDYLPITLELGRSFVQPLYQPSRNVRKGMYSLDNLWDGLGALVVDYPNARYFFGKVTMYSHFDVYARDLILHFMHKYFPDPDALVVPHIPLSIQTPVSELEAAFTEGSYEGDYKLLVQLVRNRNENIPPLFNAYMNLSSTMRTFGTALNAGFGEVEETGIMLTIPDIYDAKKDRHTKTYRKNETPSHLT
jgi:hypothetical protein